MEVSEAVLDALEAGTNDIFRIGPGNPGLIDRLAAARWQTIRGYL